MTGCSVDHMKSELAQLCADLRVVRAAIGQSSAVAVCTHHDAAVQHILLCSVTSTLPGPTHRHKLRARDICVLLAPRWDPASQDAQKADSSRQSRPKLARALWLGRILEVTLDRRQAWRLCVARSRRPTSKASLASCPAIFLLAGRWIRAGRRPLTSTLSPAPKVGGRRETCGLAVMLPPAMGGP